MKIQYEVHINGPDDLLYFDDEIKALREANTINKIYVEQHAIHGVTTPFVVATVSKKIKREEKC